MIDFFQIILDWSEVWALLIPLFILLFKLRQPSFFNPIILYLGLAFFLNFIIDIGWKYSGEEPSWYYPNNYLYNIHSIIRFACFSAFFIRLKQPYKLNLKKALPYVTLILILLNFLFFENFFYAKSFSSRLMATESALLLFYCLLYYLYKLSEEDVEVEKERPPDFWVVTGLSIYVVINFFYFLFYKRLVERGDIDFVVFMWNLHNITFIILCVFIAKAFYENNR